MNMTETLRRQHGAYRFVEVGLALAGLVCPVGAAWSADKPDPLNDPWELSVGAYVLNADTHVSADGKLGQQGTKINWNRTFGGDTQSRIVLDAQWRFAERHKLQAMWFNSSHSATKTLDRDIEWDGVVYPLNARIKGDVNYDVYLLSYEYSFMRRPTYELGGSIGTYYATWDFKLSGSFPDQVGGPNVAHSASENLGAPLPVLGVHGRWVLPHDIFADLGGRWFHISINQYSGTLQDYTATVTWQPKKWLGIGAAYDWFLANGNVDESNFTGTLDWNFHGPMLFYRASF